MSRILTGVQSTGIPHLGNLLGAIMPGIEMSQQPENEAFFFIADLHSLTTIHDADLIRQNTLATAATWLACGFDTSKGYFYRQSDIPEVTELTWYLTCFYSYNRLKLAHSFKDKSAKLGEDKVSSGLFFYPMLMAADILIYDAEVVPIGKDQKQHLEITRAVAEKVNNIYGDDTLIVPKSQMKEDAKLVVGTNKNPDGSFTKMSKSYNNFINIFDTDKKLRKTINRIETDSKAPEEPKDPDTNIVYQLYKLVATPDQAAEMHEGLTKGGHGYGEYKKWLFEAVCEYFGDAREKFNHLMTHTDEVEDLLDQGAEKAGVVAYEVLDRVRSRMGYKNRL
ncbi:UNVERIFIED_CONTAM: hypothetical protein GTU68_029077 [Idotea baltica]|nr:hypothetical protein [Idotea baltica]